MHLNADQARQAADLVASGSTVLEVAQGWGVAPSTLYNALRRHGIKLERERTPAKDHLDLQAASGTPPEIYALRAGLTLNTLRRYAWENSRKLPMNSYAERKAYWEAQLDSFNPYTARAFCVLNNLPVPMVAHWYHKLNNPSQLLLWGFTQLMLVPGDQFADVTRFNDPDATLFALGKGKTVVPIGIRLANEVYRAANPL
jgi:transposase-like protein